MGKAFGQPIGTECSIHAKPGPDCFGAEIIELFRLGHAKTGMFRPACRQPGRAGLGRPHPNETQFNIGPVHVAIVVKSAGSLVLQ